MALQPINQKFDLSAADPSKEFPMGRVPRDVLKIILTFCELEKSFKFIRLINKDFHDITRDILGSPLANNIFRGAAKGNDPKVYARLSKDPLLDSSILLDPSYLAVTAETFRFVFLLARDKNNPEKLKNLIDRLDPGPVLEKQAEADMSLKNNLKAEKEKLTKELVDAPQSYHNIAFRWACEQGHFALAKELSINAWVNPSLKKNEAICILSAKDDAEIVKILLKDPRVDPSAENNLPIQRACLKGRLEILVELLKDPRVNPMETDWCKRDAVSYALEHGNGEILKELIKDDRVNSKRKEDIAVWAIRNNLPELVREVLKDSKIDPSSLFVIACGEGALDMVRLLLKDPRVKPANDALTVACMKGDFTTVTELLKDSRIDPSEKNNSAVRIAIKRGHLRVLEILLKDSRVDPAAMNDEAIHEAIRNKHFAIITLLLKDNRVNLAAFDDETLKEVFITSCRNGDLEAVRSILKNPLLSLYKEAIIEASQNGHVEIVRELLKDSRFDPSAQNNDALYCASQNGHLAIVKELLKDVRTHKLHYFEDFYWALRKANEKGHTEIVNVLKSQKFAVRTACSIQ